MLFTKIQNKIFVTKFEGETFSLTPGEATPTKLREWAKVLQEEKYLQGYQLLKTTSLFAEDRYCCLGVLGKENGVEIFDTSFYLRTNTFKKLLDLKDQQNFQYIFSLLNDFYCFPFPAIAIVINKLADFIESDEQTLEILQIEGYACRKSL